MHNTFGINIIPVNDTARVKKLNEYQILDSQSDGAFKHIAALAVHIFKVPISFVSFVDTDRVWFKANEGMPESNQMDRGVCLCSLAILSAGLTIFPDTTQEYFLLTNPLVKGTLGLRFYAAAPLTTPDGFNLGTVCIADVKPRELNHADKIMLAHLANLAMKELEVWKDKIAD